MVGTSDPTLPEGNSSSLFADPYKMVLEPSISSLALSDRFQHLIVSTIERDVMQVGNEISRTELDSHADSPVVGRHAKILSYTGQTANVSGFTKDLGKCLSVPIVTAAVAYNDEYSGLTSILLIHNALYIKSMEHNLVPPFMI